MGDIFFIGRRKQFTLDKATELLPTVRRVTERAIASVEDVRGRYAKTPTCQAAEDEVQAILGIWSDQVNRLGCEAKGLWLVDFDNGTGYYCWRYPESTLNYFHTYDDGFSGRIPIN